MELSRIEPYETIESHMTKGPFCKTHPSEELNVMCISCKTQVVCYTCFDLAHRGHRI